MIVDTSAIVAIVFQENGYLELVRKIVESSSVGMGAASLVEAGIVLTHRLEEDARPMLSRLVQELEIEVVPLGEPHWKEAVEAYVRFGKGRHRAALNFGDCLTYATATLANRPLLFVGNDFSRTDIPGA